ncbi:MAG: CPBP family intramembrane glutamic endopeptidase [Polyangia bacterium]
MSAAWLLLLIAAFPVLQGIGYGVMTGLLLLAAPQRAGALMRQHGGLIYAGLLLIPAGLTLRWAAQSAGWEVLGLSALSSRIGSGLLRLLILVLLGLLSGALIFYNELVVSVYLHRRVERLRMPTATSLLEGRTHELRQQRSSRVSFFATSIVIVLAEELMWRGCLPDLLRSVWGLALPPAVLLSSVLFGINHAYFGLRNVAIKALDGALWWLLLYVTGSLLTPILSHLTFQLLVFRRLSRQARRAEGSHDHRLPAAV